ncbi:MAG: chaperonin GroEL, partial [Alphaproteobacteria bacterium]|nr:chaperonin GroEL [Alphaproteobacteria bacterium]
DMGMTMDNITPAVLGGAKKVVINKDKTLITGGMGDAALVARRADEIRHTLDKTTSEYDREKLAERLARLVGGVAVIKVGGMTEIEVKEKRDRVEDALAATRAAVESGIVPGGGIALLRARAALDKLAGANADINTGIEIVRAALSAPASQIIENAGDSTATIISKILESDDYNFGYNASTGEYGDMVSMGVIDPAKVVTTALLSAASTASVMLTTGCVMTEIKEEPVISNQ